MLTKDNLNETLADAVMDRPREFFIDNRRFCLWSPSLGVSILLERHLDLLNIDRSLLVHNPSMEVLRVVSEKRKEACYILAIATFRSYSYLCDSKKISERAEKFFNLLSEVEIAELLLIILTEPKAESLFELSGIKEQQKKQSEISHLKNKNGNTMSFGGKTIYGLLIDAACRAYGWTKEYVVWGIDLLSLRMMLADTISTVFLTDDDLKVLGKNNIPQRRFGMTPEDIAALKAMDWS